MKVQVSARRRNNFKVFASEVQTMHRDLRSRNQVGFSLVEMLVAITITLIIMGSVYGLMASGQSAFGREPFLADRQQQIRIAMDRIQDDILTAGENLGPFAQAFGPGLNGAGPQGVRVATDPEADSDYLEIRKPAGECPPVRLRPGTEYDAGSGNFNTVAAFPTCYPDSAYVFILYPDGRTKFGWMTEMQNTITPNSAHFTASQPDNSQIGPGAPHITGCSVWFGNQNAAASPNGLVCPLATALVPTPPAGCPSVSCAPYAIQLAEIVRYQLGTDTDGTIGLFRNWNGGVVPGVVAGTTAPSNPPAAGWQMVAAGIEDMQIEYVTPTSGGFVSDMPFFVAEGVTDNVITGVRVTLWARALTDTPGINTNVHLAGETTSQGGVGVTAVRGSLVTSTAPRSAQITLASMTPSQWK